MGSSIDDCRDDGWVRVLFTDNVEVSVEKKRRKKGMGIEDERATGVQVREVEEPIGLLQLAGDEGVEEDIQKEERKEDSE